MTALVDLRNVSKSLGGRMVVSDVSLAASPGEFIGLIGPNGAGKSTLIRVAAALEGADHGAVRISGEDARALSPIERARRLSYLPQTRDIAWGLPARDIAALGRFAFGAPLIEDAQDSAAISRALDETGAAPFAGRLVHTLSGGERARIHLARALAGETPVLLADEPVDALDPAHQLSVMALLRRKAEEGRAIIAALHDLPLAARYCTRLVVLNAGRVAYDGDAKALPCAIIEGVFGVSPQTGSDGALVGITPLHAS